MRLRLLPLLVAALALLVAPAAASAKVTVGISENQPSMFSDPLFKALGVKQVRVVMAYDVMTANDGDLNRVTDYINAANAAGVEPLVTFEHHKGDASRCNKRANYRKAVCKLPSVKTYEKNVKLFLERFPTVKVISPWNEINHFTQPTSRSPKTAAKFTDVVAKLCPSCTVVAADVLDQADSTKARNPTFRKTAAYIRTFRSALKTKRNVCGVHNYSDVNRFRSTGTKALIKALGCKQVWLTETGGLYKFGSFWSRSTRRGCKSNSSCQVKATKYLFSIIKHEKKIKRVYDYTWFGAVTPRFDAGVVANGKPRAAYFELKKHI